MTEETKYALQLYYGELMHLKETLKDYFALKKIEKKMKAIECLLDIDFVA